jgi:hypothetical protein
VPVAVPVAGPRSGPPPVEPLDRRSPSPPPIEILPFDEEVPVGPPPPLSPESVCLFVRSTSIQMTWPAVDGAVAYVVTREGGGSFDALSSAFTDEGLVPGTAYTYRLETVDAAGVHSLPSLPVTVVTRTPDATTTQLEVQ